MITWQMLSKLPPLAIIANRLAAGDQVRLQITRTPTLLRVMTASSPSILAGQPT
jgi:hypothetical protein